MAKLNKCSFCGRSENEVKILIYGLNGYICENCVEQAARIVKETKAKASKDTQLMNLVVFAMQTKTAFRTNGKRTRRMRKNEVR